MGVATLLRPASDELVMTEKQPSCAKASEGILLRELHRRKSCEARQREAGWWAQQDSNLRPAD